MKFLLLTFLNSVEACNNDVLRAMSTPYEVERAGVLCSIRTSIQTSFTIHLVYLRFNLHDIHILLYCYFLPVPPALLYL